MATGVGVSSCCLSGVVNDGKPTGREEQIAGFPTYVAEPKGDSKSKSIVLITDIFGWKLPNTRLCADEYAKAGFYVYVPDFHEGQSLPIEFLQSAEPPLKVQQNLTMLDKAKNTATVATTLGPWLVTHREAVTKPKIDGFINHLRTTPGTNKIGALGFCWGGRYAVLAAHGEVDAAVALHPSLVAVPGDFDPITKPISIGLGDKDSLVDHKTMGGIQDTLAKKTDVPHEIRIYEDQVHGFALRGDFSSEKDKKSMDEATQQGIEWFNEYLK